MYRSTLTIVPPNEIMKKQTRIPQGKNRLVAVAIGGGGGGGGV
jgi:hypothetical protein